VELVVVVSASLVVIRTDLLAVRALLDSVVVDCLQELTSSLKVSLSVFFIVLERTLEDLVILVVEDYLALAILHILFKLSFVDGCSHF
jgi:hypothetical protein